MSKLHLIMPMAGAGLRFKKAGWHIPKPLIEIHGRPFFWWSVMSVKRCIEVKDITFVLLKEHADHFGMKCTIYRYFPKAKIVIIPEVLPGAVFTCLEGVSNISDDFPVMFNDCDHMFGCCEVYDTLKSGFNYDGGLLTFESNLPNFSYVRYDNNGRCIGTVEKKAVSTHAICGAYLFNNSRLFRDLAEEYVKDCPYNECFMSGIYNVMCLRKLSVGVFHTDWHVDFGTPEQYKSAESSEYFTEDFGDAL